MGTTDFERWLAERDLRYEQTFDNLEKKFDTFATDLNKKMDELLKYIKELEDRRAKDSKKIDDTRTDVDRQRDDIKELSEWKTKVEANYKFLEYINTPTKFILWIVAVTTVTVTVLSIFGFEPMLKLISLVK